MLSLGLPAESDVELRFMLRLVSAVVDCLRVRELLFGASSACGVMSLGLREPLVEPPAAGTEGEARDSGDIGVFSRERI